MSKTVCKKVLTVGVYDLLHFGHFELFRRAKEFAGDNGKLTVAIQLDEWVNKFKKATLIYPWAQRAKMVGALRYVDEVVPYTAVDETIQTLEFDTFICGPDQNHAGFQRAKEWCCANGREVYVMPRTEGVSTTQLKEMIKGL